MENLIKNLVESTALLRVALVEADTANSLMAPEWIAEYKQRLAARISANMQALREAGWME